MLDQVAERAAAGCDAARSHLISLLRPLILSQIEQAGGRERDDLYSEAALCILEALPSYAGGRAGPYFRSCIRRRFIDLSRRETRRAAYETDESGEEALAGSAEGIVARVAALEMCSRQEREILCLAVEAGISLRAAGRRLGLSDGQASALSRRLRARLRSLF